MSNSNKKIVWTTKLVKEAERKMDDGYILENHEMPFFEKEIGLRKKNITFKMTEEEISEYIRCKMDIIYFIQNYCKVKSEDGKYHQIDLRDYQYDIVELYNNPKSILMASRQVGKCVSMMTEVEILNTLDGSINNMKMYQLLDLVVKNKTIYQKIKIKLYKLIDILS